jgi:pimeloyl-ACP methyl ester carboxylesterase
MPQLLPSKAFPATPWAVRRCKEREYGQTAEPSWRTIDWQDHLGWIEVKGRPANHVDIGEGDLTPTVLVHGLGGQWQNYLENVPRLSQDRRVVLPDLPGFGCSPMPNEKITIPFYADWLAEFLDKVGLDRVNLVGHSMGALISTEFTLRRPERVEQLVLMSAAGITSSKLKGSPGPTILRVGAGLAAYGTVSMDRWFASRPLSRHLALAVVTRYPAKLSADTAYEGLITGGGKPGFNDALRACLEWEIRDRLPQIGCPTLILWGDKDVVAPIEDAKEFEELIPDSRAVVLEDVGHVLQMERGEAFNREVVEFLAAERVSDETVTSRAA